MRARLPVQHTPHPEPKHRLSCGLPVREYPREMVFGGNHVAIAANRHVLNADHEPHSHNFFEIALIAGGRGKHACQSGERDLRAGDVIVIHVGAWHTYLACRRLVVYNCLIGPELLNTNLICFKDDARLDPLLGRAAQAAGVADVHLSQAGLRASVRHLEALIRMSQTNPGRLRLEMMANLLLFLGQLAHACSPPNGPATRSADTHPAVLGGMQLLNNDLAHAWTLSELAFKLHIDRSYLVRLFRAHTGLPPMAYLHQRRLERAAQALIYTPATVTEISRAVGWPDPNVFARRFRARFGMSASQYRAAGRPPGAFPRRGEALPPNLSPARPDGDASPLPSSTRRS